MSLIVQNDIRIKELNRPFSKLTKLTNWQIATDTLIAIIKAQR